MHRFLANAIFAQEKLASMKKAQYIAHLFILLCTMMWVVPVVPHHHHTDGQICMKDDIHDCCHQQHNDNQAEHHHGCDDKGCITTHFFQQVPAGNQRSVHFEEIQPIYFIVPILLTHIHQPNVCNHCSHCGYKELLHSTYIQRATGLRAPPCA